MTGQYFIWAGNAGGDRLDALMVKVPASLLYQTPSGPLPPILSVNDFPDPAQAGGLITYQLSYAGRGDTDLTGVVIRDNVPPETSFQSASAGGTFSNGTVTWNIGTLPAGASGSVQVTVRILDVMSRGGTIINGTATISSSSQAPLASGSPARTMVMPTIARPTVALVVETVTNSIYVPQAGSFMIRVDGSGFQDGAAVDLGPEISVGAVSFEGTGRLTFPIAVSAAAGLGPRTLTVTNPDGLSGSLADGLTVVKPTDINHDCRIDAADLNQLARAWNTRASEARFLAPADLDGDDLVGPLDLTILPEYFGQPLSGCP